MEHPWEPPIWNEPVIYNDMQAQENVNLPHYLDQKDYSRHYSQPQHRHSPMDYSKNAMQGKDELMGDPSRFSPSQTDLCHKENDESKYLYRKHFPSSPCFSPSLSLINYNKRERTGHDRVKLPLRRYTPRHGQERLIDDRIKFQTNKHKSYNQVKNDSPPLIIHHSHRRPKRHVTIKQDGCCTSCVLCRMPNNYSNPCCLCELPVCESCMKTDRNITNWRCRINCFMSKPESGRRSHSRNQDTFDEESDSSSYVSYKDHKTHRAEHPEYVKHTSYEKRRENGYTSNSSGSLKGGGKHRRDSRKRKMIMYHKNHRKNQ